MKITVTFEFDRFESNGFDDRELLKQQWRDASVTSYLTDLVEAKTGRVLVDIKTALLPETEEPI